MTLRLVTLIFGAPLLAGCAFVNAVANTEQPSYKVLVKEAEFEVREYQSMVVAETVVTGSLDEASNKGFRVIADYIFGGNVVKGGGQKTSEKIAMTAPVTMEALPPANKSSDRSGEQIAMTAPVTMAPSPGVAGGAWKMHFVMPSRYTLATLPTPNNPAITLRELPPQRFAAHQFSGFSGETKVAEKTAALVAWMQKSQLVAAGEPQLARYNAPFTPPPFRRNEVLIPIK